MYARLRPIRSAILLPIRMNAAETSASRAIADWTPLTVVSRSLTTAEIETFISDVSTTSTNIAIASKRDSLVWAELSSSGTLLVATSLTRDPLLRCHLFDDASQPQPRPDSGRREDERGELACALFSGTGCE